MFIEVNGVQKEANCKLQKNSNDIICVLGNLDTNILNVKIGQNPNDINYYDEELSISKIIIFTKFNEKQINTVIAKKIQKGVCKENNYSFNFIWDSDDRIPKEEIKFNLRMKEPDIWAFCSFVDSNIECILKGISTCPVTPSDSDIFVGDEEPTFLIINDNTIYFKSFAKQNTNVCGIKVGHIKKSIIENCQYHFEFVDNQFSSCNLDENLAFSFVMYLDENKVEANCELPKDLKDDDVTLPCYIMLNEDICKLDQLDYYDLIIGTSADMAYDIGDYLQTIKLEGFNRKRMSNKFIE
jgi:hypothetical protein